MATSLVLAVRIDPSFLTPGGLALAGGVAFAALRSFGPGHLPALAAANEKPMCYFSDHGQSVLKFGMPQIQLGGQHPDDLLAVRGFCGAAGGQARRKLVGGMMNKLRGNRYYVHDVVEVMPMPFIDLPRAAIQGLFDAVAEAGFTDEFLGRSDDVHPDALRSWVESWFTPGTDQNMIGNGRVLVPAWLISRVAMERTDADSELFWDFEPCTRLLDKASGCYIFPTLNCGTKFQTTLPGAVIVDAAVAVPDYNPIPWMPEAFTSPILLGGVRDYLLGLGGAEEAVDLVLKTFGPEAVTSALNHDAADFDGRVRVAKALYDDAVERTADQKPIVEKLASIPAELQFSRQALHNAGPAYDPLAPASPMKFVESLRELPVMLENMVPTLAADLLKHFKRSEILHAVFSTSDPKKQALAAMEMYDSLLQPATA